MDIQKIRKQRKVKEQTVLKKEKNKGRKRKWPITNQEIRQKQFTSATSKAITQTFIVFSGWCRRRVEGGGCAGGGRCCGYEGMCCRKLFWWRMVEYRVEGGCVCMCVLGYPFVIHRKG